MEMEDVVKAGAQEVAQPDSPQDIENPQPAESGATTNGSVKSGGDDDTADEGPLTPAPPSSTVSSINPDPDVPGDEIVVGTTGPQPAPMVNGDKASPAKAMSENDGDEGMDDQTDSEPISHHPKRKRTSVYNDLGEDKLENGLLSGADEVDTTTVKAEGKRHGVGNSRSVVLGCWRESTCDSENGKHSVVGFMDTRDRLRTRISNKTLNGTVLNHRIFPIPSGPGGSWVTFERIIFLDHLVGLDHNEIKEYVKIRIEADPETENEAERLDNDAAAVKEAKRRVAQNPPPDTAQPPSIAYGIDIPDYVNASTRPDAKRRRTGSAMGAMGGTVMNMQGVDQVQHLQQHLLPDNLPGARPTRIPVGVWSKSSSEQEEDKHAVYGILGANDMFRVKLVRETLDGRYVNGNFPTGAGALWIAYEEVTFLPHISGLNRTEVKEYVRVRQFQIDNGETEHDKVSNETKAVYEAQRRAALIPAKNNSGPSANAARFSLNGGYDDMHGNGSSPAPEPHELRHPRRDMPHNARHGVMEADMRQGSRHHSQGPLERTNELARREVQKLENRNNNNMVANRQMHENRAMFQDHIGRMDKVWQSQEVQRNGPMPPHMQPQPQLQPQPQPLMVNNMGNNMANSQDFKMHNGIRYERKQTGPFGGKLVSPGVIINIDGEDYVEYRVLTKPTFF